MTMLFCIAESEIKVIHTYIHTSKLLLHCINCISVFRAGLFKTYSMDLCIACAYCDTVVSANKIFD